MHTELNTQLPTSLILLHNPLYNAHSWNSSAFFRHNNISAYIVLDFAGVFAEKKIYQNTLWNVNLA